MKYPQNSTLVSPLKRRCSKSIRQAKPKITSPEVNSTGSRMLCGFPQRFLTCVLVTVILFVAPPGVRGQECSDNAGCYPPYFDILENIDSFTARTYSVSGTCGTDVSVQFRSLLSSDITIHVCNAQANTAANLVDTPGGDTVTYWQSPLMVASAGATPTPQTVEFKFTDEFLFFEIIVTFHVPNVQDPSDSADARPRKMVVEKLDAAGTAWVPLIYLATDCSTAYPNVPRFDPRSATNQFNVLYCWNYEFAGEEPFFDADNEVTYSPGFLFGAGNNLLQNNPDAIAHFTTSGIRLNIVEPASIVPDKSYVIISDVILDVRCSCSGHANVCGGPNGATCQCSHNTTGDQCTSCLPLHNNNKWQIGTTSDSNACELCTCNGFAEACTFDATRDHGVCTACQSNTAGDFCDSCVEGFYINPEHATDSSLPYCLPCACSTQGTLPSALNTCDVNSGQCTCKDRVEGRDCSVCKDTFWALAEAKPLGCDVCSCNAGGCVGNINLCDKITGRCICKTNVQGDTCNTCKAATFGFDVNNPDGCTACDCDPGASVSAACQLTNGQCTCRTQIGSRDCTVPNSGYFVSKMDLIVLEPEEFTSENVVLRSGSGTQGATVSGRGFVNLSPANQIDITFTSQYSGPMILVARYEIPSTDTVVVLQGSLDLISATGYTCSGQAVLAGQSWPLLYSNIRTTLRGGVTLGTVCLNQGSVYTVKLSNSNSPFLVDSVVLMPSESGLESALGGRLDLEAVNHCVEQTINEIRVNRVNCSSVEYSAMAAFLDGARACSCPSTAAVSSSVCDATSGACPCLTGALAPDCTQCEVDAHSFNQNTGCTECGCHPTGSVSDHCSDTGECDCLPNVDGVKCNVCANEHYGLATGQGCVPCQCNTTYSINNVCNDQGECVCKVGVAGPLCEQCLDGHYNLSPQGCTQCSCNPQGSTDRSCDVDSGACECLDHVDGNNCDTCKTGYFGLGKWHPGGCMPCFCWSHGQECSSAPGFYSAITAQAWATQTPADAWQPIEEGLDGESTVQVDMVQLTTRTGFALRINEGSRDTYDIYLKADSGFLGDRGSSYGRVLTVVIIPSPPPTSLTFSPSRSRTDLGYDVIIQGQYCSLGHAWSAASNLIGKETQFDIPMSEQNWTIISCEDGSSSSAGDTPGYTQFMEVLSHLEQLKIRLFTANVAESSALDLVYVSLDGSVDGSAVTSHSGVLVNNVELCQCDAGYTGSRCEKCGKDHTREVAGADYPGSSCIACSCNGHGISDCTAAQLLVNPDPVLCAASVTSCDPVYGNCTCKDNTGGDHCEVCLEGYYGDATTGTEHDCLPCGCPGSIVGGDVNVFASTCTANAAGDPVCNQCAEGHGGDRCEFCLNGYFGTPENATNNEGKCSPCACNGRADTCNTETGQCIDCRNDTAGQNCEICAPGFFGNAMTETCQECSCAQYPGATGVCDHVTGECECLPNVGGATCNVCDDTTYNLTAGVGCIPCDCYPQGSLSLICDKESGDCSCRNLVQGRTCEECQPGFWNVNPNTGCDGCQCNSLGTIKREDGTIDPTCDVITGQCTCALPGIIGRTCDSCSPVSKNTYSYINLFYIGTFPQCELCGDCYDSWANLIEAEGDKITAANVALRNIWTHYGDQTEAQISASLDTIEEKINQAKQSISGVEELAKQLSAIQDRFSEALTNQSAVSSDVSELSQTRTSLQATLTTLTALTETVKVTATVTTTVTALRQQLDNLISSTQALSSRGEASWTNIERLAFTVASPAERERQLRLQANALLAISTRASQNYELAATLYRSTIAPGVEDRAKELKSLTASATDAKGMATQVNTLIEGVQTDVTAVQAATESLGSEAARLQASLLEAVGTLQNYVSDTSSAQIAAIRVRMSAETFKKVSETAAEIMISSTTSVLEDLASLTQAQTDLVKAQTQANTVQNIRLPTQQALEAVIQQISQSGVSPEAVEDLNRRAEEDLFTAEQAVEETQGALAKSRELNQDLVLMGADIKESRDLRARATGLKLASDASQRHITETLAEATAHSDKAEADANNITAEASALTSTIAEVNKCFDQAGVDVSSAANSANQIKTRADSASTAQRTLLSLMVSIGEEDSDLGVASVLTNMLQANTTLTEMEESMAELEAAVDIANLVQTLQTQASQLESLNTEVDSLISEVDVILVSLQEAQGAASCDGS